MIDKNAEVALKSHDFLDITRASLSKILARDTLAMDEMAVYKRTVAWAEAQLRKYWVIQLSEVYSLLL